MQQAVASVESRLDTILAEEDEVPKKAVPAAVQPPKENVAPSRPSAEISRSGASTPANDRLQARLAHAMAKKNASRPESPALMLSDSQEAKSNDEAKPSLDSDRPLGAEASAVDPEPSIEETKVADETVTAIAEAVRTDSVDQGSVSLDVPIQVQEPRRSSAEMSLQPSKSSSIRGSVESQSKVAPTDLYAQLEADASQQKLQDEVTEFKERIDTLQNKLRVLAQQASQSASDEAKAAEPGSLEKKLAEKDKAYALLTEEYIKREKQEMNLRLSVQRLRSQGAASEKTASEIRQRAEKAERDLRIMEDRARRAEATAKRAEQNLTVSTQAATGLEAVTRERDALKSTLADIKAQLSRATQRAEAAESKATTEQLEKERKRTIELQDDLNSAKVERELSEEKLKREIKDLSASLEREKEHSRAMETEMLGEQASLESKLESFRARAEEASSSDQGDVQAKLLRQIETLQSQYAAASQNWQGIESSLLSRITNLEKERDEVANRESDVRRKLRDSTSKLKRAERDVEDAQSRLPEVEKLLGEAEEENQRYQRKITLLENDISQLRKDLEDQRAQAERDVRQRIEEEKARWQATVQTQRIDSPVTSLRKGLGVATEAYDRPVSRRSSFFPALDSPSRQQSQTSLRGLANGGIPETPSIIMSHDADEYFNNVPPTPASQDHTHSPRMMQDLVSTSTVGAGPSVQLVERMSANVRRLESEKAASKDEITRLTTQRDESRQEVVDLMREVEEKRDVAKRLAALEEENKSLAKRHQTTLELLGEKSEQVDELKADIVDVKQMYRQLADTMGK